MLRVWGEHRGRRNTSREHAREGVGGRSLGRGNMLLIVMQSESDVIPDEVKLV